MKVNGWNPSGGTREVTRAVDSKQFKRSSYFSNSGFVCSEGGPYPLVVRSSEVARGCEPSI
jgi:hypothetical protein